MANLVSETTANQTHLPGKKTRVSSGKFDLNLGKNIRQTRLASRQTMARQKPSASRAKQTALRPECVAVKG